MAKKMGLGRGLSAILPDVEEVVESVESVEIHQSAPAPADAVCEISVGDIDPNRDQPRKKFDEEALSQLADSIRHSGVLSPILVAREGSRYTILAGERRWRAARLAGAEIELAGMDNRERVLGDALDAARKDFDYIFIDCPPSLGLITLNALCAADGVLIPIQCEYYALEGVSALMGTIQKVQKINRKLAIQGVVLTMLDARTNLGLQVAQEVRKVFKGKVYNTVVPRNVRLGEAPSHGLPIHLYDPRSLGAQSYQALAKEFLAR